MRIEVYVKTSETEAGYYTGELRLTNTERKRQVQQFTFILSDVGRDTQQLIIRRKNQIFVDVKGKMQPGALEHLSEAQVMLMRLMLRGVGTTIQQIRAERAGSQGAADDAAKLCSQLGMSFGIIAEDKYIEDVQDPSEQAYVEQLLEK